MSLVHFTREVAADVVALQCHACRKRYTGADLDHMIGGADELACRDCGAGGMIPHRESSIEERFGVWARFTPLPDQLMDQRSALGIGTNELVVIWALERHRRAMGDEVFPSRERIAELTGLSVATIKRVVAKLADAGLIRRRQIHYKDSGKKASNRYDLDPLWTAVFTAGQCDPPSEQSSLPTPTAGQTDPRTAGQIITPPRVTLTQEVDVKEEVDALREVDPVGTAPAQAPPHAHACDDLLGSADIDGNVNDSTRTDDTSAEWTAFQEWWQTNHPKLTVSAAWKRWETEHAT